MLLDLDSQVSKVELVLLQTAEDNGVFGFDLPGDALVNFDLDPHVAADFEVTEFLTEELGLLDLL